MTTRTVPADFGDNQEQRGSFELILLVLQVRKWLSTPNLQRDFLFSLNSEIQGAPGLLFGLALDGMGIDHGGPHVTVPQ